MILMWGFAGLGLHKAATWSEENIPLLGGVLAHGDDEVFDGLLGIRVGDRLGFNSVELIERGVGTFTSPFETVPAFTLVGDTAKPVLSGIANFASGRWSLLSHDAQTLARAWKVVDAGVMAWTMFTEDARITKGGTSIEKNFTPTQEVLQAIGIKPTEATELAQISGFLFDQKARRVKAAKQALPYFKIGIEAAEEGKYSKALQYIKDADAIIQAYNLSDTYLAEVREEILNKVGFDRINWMAMQLIKEGYQKEAVAFEEMMKGN